MNNIFVVVQEVNFADNNTGAAHILGFLKRWEYFFTCCRYKSMDRPNVGVVLDCPFGQKVEESSL
jgi:hypothetical protein